MINKLKYAQSISEYLRYFDCEQMHFVVQEQLLADPQRIYGEIFRFLGVRAYPIRNQIVHSRDRRMQLESRDRSAAMPYYLEGARLLYDLIGFEIDEWGMG